ncbi:MAG: DUF1501 domain-containing protein [Granulosicoccus sp.]|nr:DUF1501 domain-containing protein [Granulosicoccus sp.]
MNNSNRRKFLKLGAQTMAGAGLALGANPYLTLARAAEGGLASGATDYRALVCIYLEGGSDGFSLLVPTSASGYNEYAASRQHLSVDQSSLLGINPLSNHDAMGFHPSAGPLQALFEEGKLAMIANVGNLIEPTTKEQFENGSVALPAQLFSHSDQSRQWQQLQGVDSGTTGWGALAADYLSSYQQRDYLTSITLTGSNYWQSGFGQRPFSISDSGVLDYSGLSDESDWQQPRLEAFKRVLEAQQSNVFASAYADMQQRAMNITAELGQVLESNQAIITEQQSENALANRLAMVAQLIAAKDQLGMHRQIFYVEMGGFDVHDNQNREMPELVAELSDALMFFQRTLETMGMEDSVTTFTASDFGRTLTGNGDGTDHGWGNHLMAMGGAVHGGDVYGQMPSLHVEGPDQVANGRVLPTLSASQYAATLLNWVGLDESQLNYTLPNLGNFTARDLGFLRS